MIDCRSELLQNLQLLIVNKISDEDLQMCINKMTTIVDNYEITKRSTAIIQQDSEQDKWLKMYLATKKIEGRSDKSINRYHYEIKRFLNYSNIPLNELSPFSIRSYMASLTLRGLKPATLDGVQTIITGYCKWLYDEGAIQNNPIKNINPVKVPKEYEDRFNSTEIDAIRNACSNVRERAIVEFLLSSGARISEALSIDRNNINFSTMEIMIRGKGNKYRIIYFDELASMYLQKYLSTRTDNDAALFCSSRNPHRLSPRSVEQLCKKLEMRSGVKNIHPHRFRRTLATNMIMRGVPIEKVSKVLGHANVDTTMRYISLSDEDIRVAYRHGV